jgi:hypothetical protein
VVIGYRVNPKGLFQKRQDIINEAYNALSNKVKIYREQFESIKLKTYELDSIKTANIIYSTMLKNESSYVKLEDAIKNGLLDLMVENNMEQSVDDKNNDYSDEYEYDYYEEAAATTEEAAATTDEE